MYSSSSSRTQRKIAPSGARERPVAEMESRLKRILIVLMLVLATRGAAAGGLATATKGQVLPGFVDASSEPLDMAAFPVGKERRSYHLDLDHPDRNKNVKVAVGLPHDVYGYLEDGRLVVGKSGHATLLFNRYIQNGKPYALKAAVDVDTKFIALANTKFPTLVIGDGYIVSVLLLEPAGAK